MTVRQLIEDQARRTPDAVAVAVVSGSGSGEATWLTRGELNARANRLAHHLRGLGVRAEARVGLFLDRGAGMVEAVLAVHKAGGAYVPLDPHHPADRLAFLLRDVGAELVVTTGELAARLPKGAWTPVCVDTAPLAECPDTDPDQPCAPEDLAYVLFTSGSTGTPKGVAVEHGALRDRTVQIGERYGLTGSDVCLQSLSLSFDASAGEIFPALATGARLVIGDHDWAPDRVLADFRRHGVTVSQLPVSVWQRLTARLKPGELPGSLRLLLLGGEPLPPSAIADWFQVTSVPLMNLYGPTEATITAAAALITRPSAVVPIGVPLGDVRMYVTDEEGRPVPAGLAGELWISGCLARGYLNRPELTAERFVLREFDGEPRAVYRTGDVVRQLPDGQYEFRGRIDDQVKVRGVRVEPGEVAAQVLAHPDVVSCFVTAQPSAAGENRLVAYCQLASRGAATATDLRQWCARLLPGHLVPDSFEFVDALPLTSNGKIDREALPAPRSSGEQTEPDGLQAPRVAPSGHAERVIAAAFAEVLGLDEVGTEDDFYAMGGDSFRSIQLISLVRDAGLRLSPRTILLHPTVAGIAQHVKTGRSSRKAPPATAAVSPSRVRKAMRFEVIGSLTTTESGTRDTRVSVVHLNDSEAKPVLFCLHEVSGSVAHYAELAAELAPVARVVGVEAGAVAFETPPVDDVGAMARTYFDAIRALQPQGPYFLVGYSFGGLLAMEIAKLVHAACDRVDLLVCADSSLPVLGSVGMIENDVRVVAQIVAALADDRRSTADLRADSAFVELMSRQNLPVDLLQLPKEQVVRQVAVLAAHHAAGQRYQPPTVPFDLLLFQAEESPWVTPLAEIWAPYVAELDDRIAPGAHATVMRSPGVLEIAAEISKRLELAGGVTADAR